MASSNPKPVVEGFLHQETGTICYIVHDPMRLRATIVDAVLDFNIVAVRTSTDFANTVCDGAEALGLTVDWVLESHVHADHLSAAKHVKERLGGQIAIGSAIDQVQISFGKLLNLRPQFTTDGAQFDHLWTDGETFEIGGLQARVLHTPGHTPACVCYVIGDAVFVGDTIFMPEFGTARCDFPGGDAATLFRSIQKVLALPSETRLFLCHDYKSPDRDTYHHETSVAEQRADNIHVHEGVSEEDFVKLRTERDATLGMPRLILPLVPPLLLPMTTTQKWKRLR